jgi:hypothetical protein
MRVNAWVCVIGFVGGVVWFAWLGRHGEHKDAPVMREPQATP